jgi:hypothetical protein
MGVRGSFVWDSLPFNFISNKLSSRQGVLLQRTKQLIKTNILENNYFHHFLIVRLKQVDIDTLRPQNPLLTRGPQARKDAAGPAGPTASKPEEWMGMAINLTIATRSPRG